MPLILILLTFISGAKAADWTGFKGCGLYKMNGVVRMQKNIPVLVVNEKTRSEILIHVPISNEPLLTSHIDLPVEAEVKLDKAMNGSLGEGEALSVKNRLPHPLNPMDTGLNFLKKSECKK